MGYVPDNYDQFVMHDAYQERSLRRFPVCSCCEERIQQEKAVRINGEWYCDDCLEDMKEDIE